MVKKKIKQIRLTRSSLRQALDRAWERLDRTKNKTLNIDRALEQELFAVRGK